MRKLAVVLLLGLVASACGKKKETENPEGRLMGPSAMLPPPPVAAGVSLG